MPYQPFGQWLPDQGVYGNPGATIVKNCIPRTAGSYGPFKALGAVATALSNRPQGAVALKDSDGVVYTFVGDGNDLFKFNVTTSVFDNVSKSAAAYNVAATEQWMFDHDRNRVIAVAGHSTPIQTFLLGTDSAFSDLNASDAPRAKVIGVVRDHIIVGDTWDSTDESVSNRLWWPSRHDPTDWPTIGSTDAANKQSDQQDLHEGGRIRAILGKGFAGIDGAVISDTAIHRVQYEGPPVVFGVYAIEGLRGTIASYSVVHVGHLAFYLSEDGFYRFNGIASDPVGNDRVDEWFNNELNTNFYDRVFGAADTVNKVVYWAFPSTASTLGVPDRVIMYNWSVDRWAYAEVDLEILVRGLTESYTMEVLDNVTTSLDTLSASLDSDVWKGGLQNLSAFDTDFKWAHFTGSNLAAMIETSELGGPGMSRVEGILPQVDGGTITVGLKHREGPGDTPTLIGPNAVDFDKHAHFNDQVARYFRAQVNVAAGGTWTHAQGIHYSAIPEGPV